jgi:hypothetical protein
MAKSTWLPDTLAVAARRQMASALAQKSPPTGVPP